MRLITTTKGFKVVVLSGKEVPQRNEKELIFVPYLGNMCMCRERFDEWYSKARYNPKRKKFEMKNLDQFREFLIRKILD
jgi:hypothetical protein